MHGLISITFASNRCCENCESPSRSQFQVSRFIRRRVQYSRNFPERFSFSFSLNNVTKPIKTDKQYMLKAPRRVIVILQGILCCGKIQFDRGRLFPSEKFERFAKCAVKRVTIERGHWENFHVLNYWRKCGGGDFLTEKEEIIWMNHKYFDGILSELIINCFLFW